MGNSKSKKERKSKDSSQQQEGKDSGGKADEWEEPPLTMPTEPKKGSSEPADKPAPPEPIAVVKQPTPAPSAPESISSKADEQSKHDDDNGEHQCKEQCDGQCDDSDSHHPADSTDFAQIMLRALNKCRSNHGVPAMSIKQSLVDEAQSWADSLATQDGPNNDKELNGAGECIAVIEDDQWDENDVIQKWWDEMADFDFNTLEPKKNTENFIQMVWKSTTECGCAKSKSSMGISYVVARYLPPADMTCPDAMQENVLPVP